MMKTMFLMLLSIILINTSCKVDKKQDEVLNCNTLPQGSFSVDSANKMMDAYDTYSQKNPAKKVRWVNIGDKFKKLFCGRVVGTRIAPAFDGTKVTAIVQFWDGNKNVYYNINTLLQASDAGMRGLPPVCPPPDPCSNIEAQK